jgi:hypothetical protein
MREFIPDRDYDDVAAWTTLEFGDEVVRVRAADNGRGLAPRIGLVVGQGVGNDDLVHLVLTPRDLPLSGRRLIVVCHRWPEAFERVVSLAAEQERVGLTHPLDVEFIGTLRDQRSARRVGNDRVCANDVVSVCGAFLPQW